MQALVAKLELARDVVELLGVGAIGAIVEDEVLRRALAAERARDARGVAAEAELGPARVEITRDDHEDQREDREADAPAGGDASRGVAVPVEKQRCDRDTGGRDRRVVGARPAERGGHGDVLVVEAAGEIAEDGIEDEDRRRSVEAIERPAERAQRRHEGGDQGPRRPRRAGNEHAERGPDGDPEGRAADRQDEIPAKTDRPVAVAYPKRVRAHDDEGRDEQRQAAQRSAEHQAEQGGERRGVGGFFRRERGRFACLAQADERKVRGRDGAYRAERERELVAHEIEQRHEREPGRDRRDRGRPKRRRCAKTACPLSHPVRRVLSHE